MKFPPRSTVGEFYSNSEISIEFLFNILSIIYLVRNPNERENYALLIL